jgi:2-keto-3-deoxy-L-rhamnonate aldolase RhmA
MWRTFLNDERVEGYHARSLVAGYDDVENATETVADCETEYTDKEVFTIIKNLPAMLETYGEYISAIIIGPYDMSVMVGTPANIGSDEMNKAVQEVFDICKKYNKSCGIFCDNEILAKKYRDMGANVLWMAVDRDYYMRGLNAMIDGVKDL